MKDKYHILLIGAGQLGSRHLQSLAQTSLDAKISVVDPSVDSLNISRERLAEVDISPTVTQPLFLEKLSDVKDTVDFCVIATSARPRLTILRELTNLIEVKNILFEKVLFQSAAQIDEAKKILNTKGIRAWVNCPRRMYPAYQEIIPRLRRENTVTLSANGTNWGLACNAIHLIDLWAAFTDCLDYTIDTSLLSTNILESKREGYKELSGTIQGAAGNHSFSLSLETGGIPFSLSLQIETENDFIEVNEIDGRISIYSKSEQTRVEREFKVLYQSQLTQAVAESILKNGDCLLTPFEDSASLHRPFLDAITEFINIHSNDTYTECPIT